MFRKKWVKVLFALIIVGAVGALFATGVLTPKDAERFGRRAISAGTDAVDVAKDAVTPAAMEAAGDYPAAEKCRGNLRRIESAKRAAAGEFGQAVGNVPEGQILQRLGGSLPSCPSGGRYTISALNTTPKCSIGSAGATDPKDDHVLNNF